VLDDPPLAARLASGGRRLVETRFDWDAIAAAHDAIYDAALAAPPPAAAMPVDRGPSRLSGTPALGAGALLVARAAHRRHLARR
jgi:hypothetical protein